MKFPHGGVPRRRRSPVEGGSRRPGDSSTDRSSTARRTPARAPRAIPCRAWRRCGRGAPPPFVSRCAGGRPVHLVVGPRSSPPVSRRSPLITDASRTGDMELTLVHGVHGPTKVAVLVVRPRSSRGAAHGLPRLDAGMWAPRRIPRAGARERRRRCHRGRGRRWSRGWHSRSSPPATGSSGDPARDGYAPGGATPQHSVPSDAQREA